MTATASGSRAIGAVRLNVADLDRARDFYERVVGIRELEGAGDVARLGAARPAVELVARPDAPTRPSGSTGLFHMAILVPGRLELARALRRILDSGWGLGGASDHLVSEALYLSDPEGNGIEIYRDRPREEWRYADGRLQMATLPLDIESLLGELDASAADPGPVSALTHMGHVHLQVADLAEAEDFYVGLLGFEATVRDYPGALFVAVGGYHHHIGLNTWAGEGAPSPPPGSLGLDRFEVLMRDAAELEAVTRRIRASGVETHATEEGMRVADPSGNDILLRLAP